MSMIGKTLGTFECTALLGKGGMGEVYKAKDQKLGRDVAIKVLPEEFAKDADRVARFQREAKLLASLNHPNIAAIHGLEESEGTHFLVLELIEGDTLADRLKRGAIPVEESLKLALQIAEALEAAHEKGVIHRDLKPANIKVTPDGKVKVLDFGLAKAFAGDQAEVNLSHSPTLSEAATLQGVILGTAAYMSPEQARGKPMGKRTDIWAFGCVLYEMLTGKAAFQGEDVTEILAAVVKSGVNLDLLPANIHTRVREVITRCLQKDQKKRYSGIDDAQYEIQQVLADPSGIFAQPVTAVKPRRKVRVGLPWVVATAILCFVIATVAVWMLKSTPPPEPKRVIHFDHHLPEDQQFNWNQFGNAPLAVSPEGSHFVYGTRDGLYLRSLNDLEASLIRGTDGNSISPFFSPDGNWLGFVATDENKLKKVSISGGAPIPLCDVQSLIGVNWNTDDTIIYGTLDEGIMLISAEGGIPETLIEVEGGLLFGPQILPDGKRVLYLRWQTNTGMISIHSLESNETEELFEGDRPRYLSTGHLVYKLDNNLLAVPFDPDTNKEIGGPRTMVEGVGPYSISDEGTLVFIPGISGTTEPEFTLVWMDREGNEDPLGVSPANYDDASISPDGTRVALMIDSGGNEEIHIWDIARKKMDQLTFTSEQSDEFLPVWTHDSKRIIFASDRTERISIFWKAADGMGKAEQLASMPDITIVPESISSDGKTLIIESGSAVSGGNIGMVPMEGDDHTPEFLLQEEYEERNPEISPDGRWLAYQSNEDGQFNIYVCSFPDGIKGGKKRISTEGGQDPVWSSDGSELFYRSPEGVMSVSIEAGSAFQFDTPKLLFASSYELWDIHPDNKRLLMLKPAGMIEEDSAGEFPRQINIVLNWFEELKDRVPVD